MDEKTLLKNLDGFNPLDLRLARPGCLIKYFYYDNIQKKYTFRMGGFLREVNREENYLLLGGISNKVKWKVYLHDLPDRPAPVIYYKNSSTQEIDKLTEFEEVVNLIDSNNNYLIKLRTESKKNLTKLINDIIKLRRHIESS